MKKRFIIVALILFIVFGGLVAYHFISQYLIKQYVASYEAPPVTVNTLQLTPVKWSPTYDTVGSVQAVQGTDVSPIVSGMVTKILFTSGQIVKKNQILVVLDTDVLTAEVNNAQALNVYNKQTYERYKTLFHEGVISASDLDQAASNYGQSNAALQQQFAMLEQKYVLAPFAGQVGIRDISLGQYLNAGTMITNIQSVNPMYINFQVPEQFLPELYIGQPIKVSIDSYHGVIFNAKITAFDAQVANNTKAITVQATAPNTHKKTMLLPGMQANIEILLPVTGQVIAIPQQAINYSLYGNTVFTVVPSKDKNGKADLAAKEIAITPADQSGNLVRIVSGLKAGDQIVVDGQVKLQDGNSIKVVATSTQS
ncbi:MAG: efflux RND transporter periplasmic adaptor subunit [Gammaproteobacteria bacterium]|nr:efflux RND transporter periplasmic adaptor subunit [Gammaproteobacteria bacterium]